MKGVQLLKVGLATSGGARSGFIVHNQFCTGCETGLYRSRVRLRPNAEADEPHRLWRAAAHGERIVLPACAPPQQIRQKIPWRMSDVADRS